jgi:hypothetical protein
MKVQHILVNEIPVIELIDKCERQTPSKKWKIDDSE